MAAVEFGDSELFEQFEDNAPEHVRLSDEAEDEEGESSERLRELRQTLDVCEETIERLNAENEELKRKLNILSRPTGIKIDDSQTDGPLCQVNYGNNIISKQCRKEMEDFIFALIQNRQENKDAEGSDLHVNPHHSSFIMEESYKVKTSSDSKHIKKAFSVIGSVLYFTNFCVDKLGQPLLNENPQLTDGWEIPKYQQVFGHIIALEGQDVQIKEKRPKPCCFNCCSEEHQLRDCPEPKDMARISAKRKEFSQNNQGNQRYHAEEVEERFAKFKPGILSQELRDALSINLNTLPPFIYRMRELGYPPGWLKEAEMENSGLMLYDGSNDDEENNQSQKTSYDVSKLVDFPGFNVSTPPNMRDDFRSFGSIPMQPQHWKQNFAAFLSSNFPEQGSSSNKRQHENESTPQRTKKWKSGSDHTNQASDMQIESGDDSPQMRSEGFQFNFQFHPPLPPGTSSMSVPPPLPLGTPPSTPPIPKGTPPPTPPTNDIPSNQGRAVPEGEESEDGLTLEELEEQQRLLWAALETADTATNSDSDAGASASQTPVPSSPSVVTSLKLDSEEDGDKMEVSSHTYEIKSTPTSPAEPETNVCEDERNEMVNDGQEKRPVNDGTIDLTAEISDIIVLDEVYEENGDREATNGTSDTPLTNAQDSSNTQESKTQDESKIQGSSTQDLSKTQDSSKPQESIIQESKTQESNNQGSSTQDSSKTQDSSNTQVSNTQNESKIQGSSTQDESKIQESSTQDSSSTQESNTQGLSTQDSSSTVAVHTEDMEESSSNKVTFVPHRSKFAAGIIPFEDTPEFTEVAEATGVYLKIRDLLKGSPRSQAKNKK